MDPKPQPHQVSHGVPLHVATATDVGRVRLNNEDAARFEWDADGSLLVVVADGMGGHDAGEIASRLAVDALAAELGADPSGDPRERLYRGLLHTNQVIIDEAKVRNTRGMGTTAVAAVLRGAEAFVSLIGDSRAYWIRRGRVVWRSLDHTRVQALVDLGEVSVAEARDHPEAGMLTRALGHAKMIDGRPLMPEVFAEPLRLEPGDAMVLCTDGLHDLLEDDEIGHVVAGRSPEDAARTLVRQALERGGHDNVTVSVVVAFDPTATSFDPGFHPVARPMPPPFRLPADPVPSTVEMPTALAEPSEATTERISALDRAPESMTTVESRRIPLVTVLEIPTEELSRPHGLESSPSRSGHRERSPRAGAAASTEAERRVSPSWDPRWTPPVEAAALKAPGDRPVRPSPAEPGNVAVEQDTAPTGLRRRDVETVVVFVLVLVLAAGALGMAVMFGGLAWFWGSGF